MHLLPFNINDSIQVKLTEYGIEKYLEAYNKHIFLPKDKKDISYILEKTDKEGYIRFQTWDFINIFGEHMYMSGKSCIEGNTIYFEDTSFKNPKICVTKKHKLIFLSNDYK